MNDDGMFAVIPEPNHAALPDRERHRRQPGIGSGFRGLDAKLVPDPEDRVTHRGGERFDELRLDLARRPVESDGREPGGRKGEEHPERFGFLVG